MDTCRRRDPFKKREARLATGIFIRGDRLGCDCDWQSVLTSELSDELSIGSARRTAKLMIEVRNVRPVAKVHERIKQCHGVGSTRDADDQWLVRPEEISQGRLDFF